MIKIIIVDDENASLNSMGRVISGIRKDVEIAGLFDNISLVMEFLRQNSVDIILSDIKMPGGDGIELARFVQENYPDIKMVFFSAYSDFEYAQQAISLNVKHYLSKPINIEELNATFNNLIELIEKENINRREKIEKERKYRELLSLAKADLYADILSGILNSKGDISARIKSLEMTPSEATACHGVLMARCENSELFLEGRNGYYQMLSSVMLSLESIEDYVTVIRLENEVVSVVRFKENISFETAGFILSEELNKLKSSTLEALDVKINFEVAYVCDNVYKLCDYKNMIDDNELFEMKFREISTAIFEADSERIKANFESLVSYAQTLESSHAKRIFDKMFSHLENCFSVSLAENSDIFNYTQLWKAEKISDIISIAAGVIAKLQKEKTISSKGIESYTIELIKEYIGKNYMYDIVLDDVAHHVNLSSFYISKFFKAKTGQGLSDYITSVRINNAIELMKTQKYKVYEISEMCGYKSRKYFTHTFKQHTGYTPSEYQRML